MSVVEDVRKVVQDFLAPELRTITEQLSNIRKDQVSQREDQKVSEQRVLNAIEQAKSKLQLVIENTQLKQRVRHWESSIETNQQAKQG